ncbi:YcbK family protein [Aquibium sp. A9E412]|uniref:YcbK family protein n=1 Tax=Aquibium sp. A9E412 TaxID=2976767 RepID=UPI0025B16FCD|nr:YcbK family protein [Aquibium sp. A9E412]MDN2564791.1 YcbK family protein [Aquibium sp. A9E412]
MHRTNGRPASRNGLSALAGLCALLALSACTTAGSDPIAQLGLAPGADFATEVAFADGEVLTLEAGDGADATTAAAPEAAAAAAPAVPAPAPRPETAALPDQPTAAAAPSAETAGTETAAAEPAPPAAETAAAPAEPAALDDKRRGFLSAFFSPAPARGAQATQRLIEPQRGAAADGDGGNETRKTITLAAAERPARAATGLGGGEALPGVRQGDGLFEISRRSGMDDDSDVDLYEGEDSYQVASAAGLARLAPNGLLTQRDSVDVACLKPALVRTLKTIERHYGKPVVVTSGYRNPKHNKRVRGARNSLHMYCAAADVQVDGVSKWELAKFVRAMPGRGGVGTYCHTNSVHVDVGPERDWNWRCRRRKR